MRVGEAIGADGVVVHPGSAKKDPVPEALERIVEALEHVLAETSGCRILLEDTAGAGGTIGRSFEELAALIDGVGGRRRSGSASASTAATCSPRATTSGRSTSCRR